MKKALKIGGILIVVGIVIAAVGFFSHRQPFNPFNEDEITHVNKQTLSKKAFSRVKITAASADVTIKESDHYGVYYYGKSYAAVKAKVRNGQLTVTQTHAIASKHVSINWWTNGEDRVVITVPHKSQLADLTVSGNSDVALENVTLAKAHINTAGGDLTINRSQIDGGSLTTADGDIAADNSRLAATRLNSASGDIDLNRVTVNAGKASLSSGDFTARKLTVNGHYLLNNQSGDNDVQTSNHPGAILTSDSGDNELGHSSQDDGGTLDRNPDAANLIRITSQSGDNTFK